MEELLRAMMAYGRQLVALQNAVTYRESLVNLEQRDHIGALAEREEQVELDRRLAKLNAMLIEYHKTGGGMLKPLSWLTDYLAITPAGV